MLEIAESPDTKIKGHPGNRFLADVSPKRISPSPSESPSAPKVGVRLCAEHVSFSPGGRVKHDARQLRMVTCVRALCWPARRQPRSEEDSPSRAPSAKSNFDAHALPAIANANAPTAQAAEHASSQSPIGRSPAARNCLSPAGMLRQSPTCGESDMSPERLSSTSSDSTRIFQPILRIFQLVPRIS